MDHDSFRIHLAVDNRAVLYGGPCEPSSPGITLFDEFFGIGFVVATARLTEEACGGPVPVLFAQLVEFDV
ncbi:hypothetical protein GX50_04282 [[Emmonsia] crescens]|uniref:Uncharacterized protein n=1 Tax=[Emmonsia] crescens TaxID=73230 RepID=A0A2B7ZIE7_9EURO|nr:hypothetical protein GX50_04282 [Emmonsia crescens]